MEKVIGKKILKAERDFVEKKLHPLDLKNAVAREISDLMSVVQKKRAELDAIANKAWKR